LNPGGDAGWDGPPLDIQVPDDARELDRDVLAYHRELRAIRRRRRLRRIMPSQAGVMPLIASILAVCLVAGMMLSVFTISPTDGPAKTHAPATQSANAPATQSAKPRPSLKQSSHAQPSRTPREQPTR
jgi:anti-sigma factor RsiW